MSQIDTLPGLQPGAFGPATRGVAVVPDDGAPLPLMARFLMIGAAGDVTLLPRDNQLPLTIYNAQVGRLDIWTRKIFATGTTASLITALA